MPPSRPEKSPSPARDKSKDPQVLTIAFLKCDKIHEASRPDHGTYEDVLHNLFQPLLPSHLELETLTYDVVNKRHYPTESELARTDCLIISGSFQLVDVATLDAEWLLRLAGFLIRVKDDFPHIRIVGVCFGLQVLSRAFGGGREIGENEKGWEVGSTRLELTELGQKIIWGEGLGHKEDDREEGEDKRHMVMQQIHGDIVKKCPDTFELLASSELSPVQSFVRFYPDSADEPPAFTHSHGRTLPEEPWRRIHIIAFQGHPEWHEDIIVPFIDDYVKDGTLTEEFAAGARERARSPHDGIRVGRVILRILGVV